MKTSLVLIVSEDDAPERLDRYLGLHAPDLSRTRAKEIILEGLVTLNGAPAKPSAEVGPGDVITADVPELATLAAAPERIPLDVCYEDDDLMVVDKPVGMVVHPAPGAMSGTLVNALLGRGAALSGVGGTLRPGIVHRLDKDTSGLVVVAKNDAAHRALAAAFEERRVRKTYLALAWGAWGGERDGAIEAPIGRHRTDRKRMAVVSGGRAALTRWSLREDFPFAGLLEVHPETGRTHQIRVHLAHARHSVIGDRDYGGVPRSFAAVSPHYREQAKSVLALAGRQMLHAREIVFEHPGTGKTVRFVSPLPDDFARALSFLRRPEGERGRVISVDPGEARVGVAVSDEGRFLAAPADTLTGLSDAGVAAALAALAKERGADTVVVGYAIRMDGTIGARAARARELAVAVEDAVPARVVLWDERLSSAEAERMLVERGEKTRGRKGRVDQLAAAIILQGYLDSEASR
jgi:23S rRNA pseudouridine1911/1915/1917 synthase